MNSHMTLDFAALSTDVCVVLLLFFVFSVYLFFNFSFYFVDVPVVCFVLSCDDISVSRVFLVLLWMFFIF